jgi:hypothetical protein
MSRWPHDDPASLAAFYGDPNKGEPGKQLVAVIPPFQMYYAGKPVPHIMFHRKAAGALRPRSMRSGALRPRPAEGRRRADLAFLRRPTIRATSAATSRATRRATPRWSNHAYGAAIDFDAEHNGFNTGHGTMPPAWSTASRRRARCGAATITAAPIRCISNSARGAGGAGRWRCSIRRRPMATATAAKRRCAGGPASASGFFGRARNWVVAAASSIGFSGLGALTNWQIAAVLFAFIFLSVVCTVSFIICFFGAEPVRDWVRRHVA